MVYFFEVYESNEIKIGYTINLKRRMLQWNKVLGFIQILGVMEGELLEEKEIHQKFTFDATWRNVDERWWRRELFIPTQRILNFIINHTYQTEETAQINAIMVNQPPVKSEQWVHILTL